MNLNDLQRKLIAVARAHSPAESVPYGFDKRITHCLKGLGKVDSWAFWSQALWRAAAPCVGLALVLAALSFLSSPRASSGPDVSQELENTVLAAANVDQPSAEPLR